MELPLYPLQTVPRTVAPLWGGNRLAEWLDLSEPYPKPLGEIWLVYEQDPICNGPLAGQTLATAARTMGAALLGSRTARRYGTDFPLLAKFIDAGERLSIQVHPDDTYAHTVESHTGFHGKTEAWYILDTIPEADVTYGLKRVSSRAEFVETLESNQIETLLHRMPVASGQVVFVPAGIVHAINAGIMLFEIQQKSNLTYRVYDYNRRDAQTGKLRELHLDKALDVIHYGPAPYSARTGLALGNGDELLVACPYFALERWSVSSPRARVTDPRTFELLTVLDGSGVLSWRGSSMELRRGTALVLPANLGYWSIAPAAGATLQLLHIYVPDLEDELVPRLRAAGISPSQIMANVFLL